jgi:hypothetical protein
VCEWARSVCRLREFGAYTDQERQSLENRDLDLARSETCCRTASHAPFDGKREEVVMSNSETTSGSTEGQVVDASQSVWAGRAGPIFWAGLVVGLLLTIGGFASLSGALAGNTTGQLILCSGLGIVFGAFGSTGTAKYKGVVITGVAAIAITLLVLVDYLIQDSYVRLEITGDVDGAQIEVVGDENYLGAPRDRRHDFIIIGRQIRKSVLTVSVSPPIEDQEAEAGGEFLFECVRREVIENRLGSGETIQWRFDKDLGQLIDIESQRKIADVGGCPDLADSSRRDASWSRRVADVLSSAFLSRAFAGEAKDTTALLQDLESSSAYARRKARELLAAQGLPAVRQMLDRLVAGPSYRTRVGVIVAMTEMLRQNKGDRAKVSELMTQDDINAFVEASGDKDRTIRVYASEFLYDLGDARAINPIFERFTAVDDTGKYNMLVALKGVYPALDPKDREAVDRNLAGVRETVGPRTQELIDRMAAGESSAEQRYWVIIASYTDESDAKAHADRVNDENPDLKAFVGKRQPNNAYYPVIVGNYVGREEADALVMEALRLRSIQDYGTDPYLSAYADRRP